MFKVQMIVAATAGLTQAAWVPSAANIGYFGWRQFRTKNADVKLAELWDECTRDTTPAEVPYELLDDFFSQDMNVTLCRPGDEMKTGFQKVMHAQGVVGLVRWEDLGGHSYTGMFDGGVDSALIRLSESNFAMSEASGLTPSFAMKFQRDGIESVNLFGAVSFEASDSWNFFENDFSNRIGVFENLINKESIEKKFGERTKFIGSTGLGEFSRMQQCATEIEDYVTPYSLRYVPTSQVRNLFGSDQEIDDAGEVVGFQEQLQSIPEGTTLFEVWARDQPTNWDAGSTEQHIANVRMTTELTTSAFGDQRLFFQHEGMRFDHDFEGKWSWNKHAGGKIANKTADNYDYLGEVAFPADRATAKAWVQESLVQSNCPFAWIFN